MVFHKLRKIYKNNYGKFIWQSQSKRIILPKKQRRLTKIYVKNIQQLFHTHKMDLFPSKQTVCVESTQNLLWQTLMHAVFNPSPCNERWLESALRPSLFDC